MDMCDNLNCNVDSDEDKKNKQNNHKAISTTNKSIDDKHNHKHNHHHTATTLIFIKGAKEPYISNLNIHNPTIPKNSTLITGEAAKLFLQLAPIVNDIDKLADIIINHPNYKHECATSFDSQDRWIQLLGGRKSREFNFKDNFNDKNKERYKEQRF